MTIRWRHVPAAAVAAALALGFASAAADAAATAAKKSKQPGRAKASRSVAAADPAHETTGYLQREDVMRFGAEIAERNALDAAWVLATLADARYQPGVAKAILPPPAGTANSRCE